MLSRLGRFVAFVGHARTKHLLILCGLLVGLIVSAGAALLILDLRSTSLADAKRELGNLSLVLSLEIDQSLQSLELVESGLVESMRQSGIDTPEALRTHMASRQVHQNLQDRIAGLPFVSSVTLFDSRGALIGSSGSWPAPLVSIADRDFFPWLTADLPVFGAESMPTSLIAGPVVSRTSGKLVIILFHRFTALDGSLLGIIGGSIETASLEQMFSRISVGGGGSFALFHSDGMLLARYPHLDSAVGHSIARTTAFTRILAALNRSVFTEPGVFDGKERLVAPHSLPHYPLIIASTITVQTALASWRGQARSLTGAALLCDLVIVGIVLLGVRHIGGYEQLQAAEAELAVAQEREQAAHELQVQSTHFNLALSNMQQGLCMYDDSFRVLVANPRFGELFDLPQSTVVAGMAYSDVVEHVLAAGVVCEQDMQEIRERRRMLIDRQERATFDWELASGRTITVTHQPMQDGWLTTYQDITEHRQTEARMAHMALHDALTELPNRVLFRQKLDEALSYVRRGGSLALLCLDLDQFKAVNDTLGHPVGDRLLRAVAERLAQCTRDTDTVARLGGDEFAIVQPRIEKPTEATGFASRLIELIQAPFDIDGHQIVIGTSVGIAFAPQDGMDADQLLRGADLALYRAKSDGRGVYRLFHAEMDAQMQARRLLELDLRHALRTGQFELFYQPLVDLRAGTATGFEALLRWRHPERGIVSPAEFIPLAEEIGLIVPLGEWVLCEACKTAASWPGAIRVAVNLSPAQFKSRNLMAAVAQALQEAQLAPDRLELEITETVMLQDTDATLATLHQLRVLGVGIAMDDFGTGYSSLSYLRRFPFDRIKIDQSFVRELSSRRDCGAIVRAVAGLSRDLGMATTVEGVETGAQLSILQGFGCTEVQGYLFSPAVPRDDVAGVRRRIEDMLRSPVGAPVPEAVA